MESQTVVVGQWGGDGGQEWDDGIYTGIRAIEITHYPDSIRTLEVTYDLNGQTVKPPKHPVTYAAGNYKTVKIELQFPEEYIVNVSGFTGDLRLVSNTYNIIRSLTIKTNLRTYGPFGDEVGSSFSVPIQKGYIAGFTGRSGGLIDALSLRLAISNI